MKQSALVPPPPVNQNLGIYDRTFTGFVASDCLGCHDPSVTDPTAISDSIALRHHMMLYPTNPKYNPSRTCTSCHTPDGTGNMTVTVNCPTCHTSTPHHKSANAQARHCNACHGSLINNFDDGHYIPTYAKSIVTPEPSCKVWTDNTQTTCAAGGCRTCHVASTAITPNTFNNDQTHHGTGLGQGTNPPSQCGWCHNITTDPNGVPTPAIDIRTCETCHGPTSLHGIEYQYNTNNGTAGYGHIGHDQDCWGCHGFFDKYDLPPSFGPTIPTIDGILPLAVCSGAATEIVISGQSLTNSVTRPDGTVNTYNPVVVLSQVDDTGAMIATQAVTPTSFTESEVRVTVPATLSNSLWEVRVYKDYQGTLQVQSNNLPLMVHTCAAITSASLSCVNNVTTLTVTGSGFGPTPPQGAPFLGVFVGGAACTVSSWSDTQIVATCSAAAVGDQASVVGLYNAFSPVTATISGSACVVAKPPTAAAKLTQGASVCGPSPSCASFTTKRLKIVTFDASGSSAVAPATIRSYSWVITNSAGAVVWRASTRSFSYIFLSKGAYTSTLVVTDSAGLVSAPAVTAITIQ